MKNEINNTFNLLFDYGLGGEIDGDNLGFRKGKQHGNVLFDIKTDYIPLAKKHKLCNGFRYWTFNPSIEKIRDGMKGGFNAAIIDIWAAQRYCLAAAYRGFKTREYVDRMIDFSRKMIKKHGCKVWVNAYPEYDNDQWNHYAGELKNRSHAYQRLRKLYESDNEFNMYPPPEDPAFPPPPKSCIGNLEKCKIYCEKYLDSIKKRKEVWRSVYNYLKERKIKPDEINLVNLCCQTFSTHLLYEIGVSAVWPEGNVGNNHQIVIAFTRGAARQYHRHWIYDAAPFDCQVIPLPMCYDTRRRRIAGFTESYMLRSWLVSYLSGAKTFLFQASDLGFFIRDKKDNLELSPAGEHGKDFANFTLRNHPDRGRARAPIALLMSRDHGYTLPYRNQPKVFGGNLPDDRANQSIEAFFRMAFPGIQNSNGKGFDTSGWAANGSRENQAPWVTEDVKTAEEYSPSLRTCMRDSVGDGDFRSREQAFLTTTTWGDSFDVLVDNAPLDVLKDYKAIILMGNITIDGDLRKRIEAYVKAGGNILVNASQVSKKDEELLGIRLLDEMGEESHFSYSPFTRRLFCSGRYNYAKVELDGAVPMVAVGFYGTTRDINRNFTKNITKKDIDITKLKNGKAVKGVRGDFIATKNRFGKGSVCFVTVPDYQTKNEMKVDLHEGVKEVFDDFIRPHLGVEIDGPPLEWIINDTDKGIWISLFNNSKELWIGKIIVKDKLGKVVCRDIWNEKHALFEYDEQGKVVLKPEIAPWKFKIISVIPQQSLLKTI